ncbi:MAG: 50S ribosomal protein L29 [Candidatus Dependentiae bacterium]|nr:50S ribosomal protein L29 [Candidatus Dependentiae bacterium]
MKTNDFKKELQQLAPQQLEEVLDGLQRELFKLKLNASTMHLKDYSLFKKVKRNIARVLTCINAKESK